MVIRGDLVNHRIEDALLWLAITGADCALEVSGDLASGHIFVAGGHPYFGSVAGDQLFPHDLDETGIATEVWKRALQSPIATTEFAKALLHEGAEEEAVAAFGRSAVDHALARLGSNTEGSFGTIDLRHPFGSQFKHEIVSVGVPVAVLPESSMHAVVPGQLDFDFDTLALPDEIEDLLEEPECELADEVSPDHLVWPLDSAADSAGDLDAYPMWTLEDVVRPATAPTWPFDDSQADGGFYEDVEELEPDPFLEALPVEEPSPAEEHAPSSPIDVIEHVVETSPHGRDTVMRSALLALVEKVRTAESED